LRWDKNAAVLHKTHKITGPSGGHSGSAEGILQNQVPANDPGENFSQRRVAIGIGRASDRDQRRKFSVAKSRKRASYSSQNEGQHNGWAGIIGSRLSGQDENSGTDNCTDSQ